jgi:hypothetical protein
LQLRLWRAGARELCRRSHDDLRTELNTEGVFFYKVWNGHAIQLRTQVDDMPAFPDKLSKNEVWSIVEYLKVLRTPQR